MKLRLFSSVIVPVLILLGDGAFAAAPSPTPPIIARGEARSAIKSVDIHERPNRPMHFYGNTVRRRATRL